MFGEESDVTARVVRKRLLLMESDLNRAALCSDASELVDDLKNVGEQVHSVASVASNIFHSLIPSGDGEKSEDHSAPAKSSWISTIVRGVRFGTSVWLAFRSKS